MGEAYCRIRLTAKDFIRSLLHRDAPKDNRKSRDRKKVPAGLSEDSSDDFENLPCAVFAAALGHLQYVSLGSTYVR